MREETREHTPHSLVVDPHGAFPSGTVRGVDELSERIDPVMRDLNIPLDSIHEEWITRD